jgi:glycosyltransferase involved in cell wall biosynthesis
VDQRHVGYWEAISTLLGKAKVKRIYFAGPNADVFSFLHEFKVFVMVSHAQGCPNASLEAMAAGLPVVANNDGGTHEQVVHGRTGYLVNGDDPTEMAERVAKLLREPARARRFGEAGRRRMKKHFSMKKMVDNYNETLYSNGSFTP